jgi:uncharacterized membrane protein
VDELITILARVGIVGAGLIGGAFFAFSTFIMAALKQLPDVEGIKTMQQINRTVYTPWFMIPFLGTTLLSVSAIVLGALNTDQDWWIAMLSAGVLYAFGVFLITGVHNVPLNNKLDRIQAEDESSAETWRLYLKHWTRWNHVRTVSAVLSIVFFALVLLNTY